MIKFSTIFLFGLFLTTSPIWMFDSGHVAALEIKNEQAFISSFAATTVHYVIKDGNSIVSELDEDFKYLRSDIRFFIRVFLDKKGAEDFKKEMQDADQRKHYYVIKSVSLAQIVQVMLNSINSGRPNSLKNPNVVVFDGNKYAPLFPEYFASLRKGYHTIEIDNQQFIPLFLSQQEAIAYEKSLPKKTQKVYTRRGKNIGPTLEMINSQSTKPVKFLVLGRNAVETIQQLQKR